MTENDRYLQGWLDAADYLATFGSVPASVADMVRSKGERVAA